MRIVRDDDYLQPLVIKTKNLDGSRTVLNLTGYTLESKVTHTDGTTTTVTATITDAVNGAITLELARAVTSTFVVGNSSKWYLALINPANKKFTYLAADVIVKNRGES